MESILEHSGVKHEASRNCAATDPQGRTTMTLARHVIETRFEDIPLPAREAARRFILDEIALAASISKSPVAQALYALKGEQGGKPEATLIGDGRKVPAASAAYVNAHLPTIIEATETLHNRMHTLSPTVMSALAIAEKTGASGKEMIAAVAAGYDITARVGRSLTQFIATDDDELGFYELFGWGWSSFGAAAAAGRLLKLDAGQVAEAFGQAYVTSPLNFDLGGALKGVFTDEGRAPWHKYQLPGVAAEAGINAALLIGLGWVSRDDIFDEGSNFYRSFSADRCIWDNMYGELGQRWYIAETAFRKYPFCRFGGAALDGVARLVAENGLTPDDIEDIRIRVAPSEVTSTLFIASTCNHPLKLYQSLVTAVALTVLGIPAGPKWFDVDFQDKRIRDLARRVRQETVPEWKSRVVDQIREDGYFKGLPTEVIIRTHTGAEYSIFAEYASGDPWSDETRVNDQDVVTKARQFLDGVMPDQKIEALVSAVMSLDAAGDVSAISDALSP